jgi:hypothetical protein
MPSKAQARFTRYFPTRRRCRAMGLSYQARPKFVRNIVRDSNLPRALLQSARCPDCPGRGTSFPLSVPIMPRANALCLVTLIASGHPRLLAALRWQEETSRDCVITRVGGTLAPTVHAALAPISLAAHFPFLLPLVTDKDSQLSSGPAPGRTNALRVMPCSSLDVSAYRRGHARLPNAVSATTRAKATMEPIGLLAQRIERSH